jgi:TolA-binding protein
MNRLLSIGVTAASLALAVPASAQLQSREAIALQDQILQLQHDIQALQAQQQRAPAPQGYYAQPPGYAQGASSDIVSQLLTRVNNLEDEVRQLRGRVDDLQNNLQQSTADLNKQFDDLRFQLQNPGGSASAGAPPPRPVPPARPPQEAAVVPPPPPPRPAPAGALEPGTAAFQRGDYATAAKEAQQVLNRRASPNAYDAQFLLAQSYAGMHDWSRAAIAYDDAYNRAPKGSHAEAALLGLAISLTAISERRAACETITKLHSQFPHPSPRLIPQINGVAARAGCA